MAKARSHVTGHILSKGINTAALWALGCSFGNILAGVAWFASFTPALIAPAFVAGIVYGLATMPVYVIVIDKEGN